MKPFYFYEPDYYREELLEEYPVLKEDKPSELDKIITHLKFPLSI